MKQITEDYVSYETAKLLQEKGFDVPTMHYFSADGNKIKFQQAHYIDDVARPTQSLALKWLREVHNIHITLHPSGGVWNGSYTWSVYYKRGKQSKDYQLTRQGHEKSYEEACEAALLYVLKNLI